MRYLLKQEEGSCYGKARGCVSKDPGATNNGRREKALIVRHKLTSDPEKDNLVPDDENGKVRLIEEEFMKRVWPVER